MKKLYIETYGCQMNTSDSQLVATILKKIGFENTENIKEADLILINTCSVRENAESRIYGRLKEFAPHKRKKPSLIVGVLGCMAERLKEELLENKVVDMVIGPDSYRDIPVLLEKVAKKENALSVLLSDSETYDDIVPEIDKNSISAFVSIMRGCNNFCTYCIVPYVRGRERSKKPESILNEIRVFIEKGIKEITLLGQNVDSYNYEDKVSFANLLEMVAVAFPNTRIRFATSHPKDMNTETLKIIATYKNICKYIHLPLQSGSNKVLKAMKRKYTFEDYMDRINAIRIIIPYCGISTDVFCGFCGETEEDHNQTLEAMRLVKFDYAFMFKYSERPGTYAAKKLDDNVTEEVKVQRLNEIIDLQRGHSMDSNKKDIGKTFEVLVEGASKKSEDNFRGRNSQNKVIIYPKENAEIGQYVNVLVEGCSSAILKGKIVK